MVDFSKREDVRRWLDAIEPAERRREVAIALAARAALRVLPLLGRELRRSKRTHDEILSTFILPPLRATALSWVAAKYPAQGHALGTAAFAVAFDAFAHTEADDPAAHDAARATTAAFVTLEAADAAFAAADAVFAAVDAASFAATPNVDAAIFAAAFADAADAANDAALIDSGRSGTELAGTPLWPNGAPDWASDAWRTFKSELLAADQGWEVWTDWYEARLAGDAADPPNEALGLARATIPDEIWKQGPAAVNAEIKRLIDLHTPKSRPRASWDFFISYAKEDERSAREVVGVLEGSGYSTVAQFKDFRVGANFVNEMNRGLAGMGRFVALYSPHYQASEHCQTEWNAAYNSDPSGAKRKLVAFLLKPTALTPLARQIVYRTLVGLTKGRRKKAILEAIAPQPPTRDPEDIKRVLAEVASPQASINAKEQLDAGPNATFDRPFVDADLPELPSIQRGLADTICKSLPRNTPPVVGVALEHYSDHLLERGTQPIVRYLDDLAAALRAEHDAPESIDWGKGLATLFQRFFANDALLRTHFPLKGEETFAELPIDEDQATGAVLAEPIDSVAAALQQVVAANKATPTIAKAVLNSAAFARDLASLPPAQIPPDPTSKRVTVKRRYVLGTIGFLVTIYGLIGTTASIYGIPEGAALLKAVSEAIEKLMSLLL